MDLPATQAVGDDDFPATQQFSVNEDQDQILVGMLTINSRTYSILSGITKIGRHPECQIVLNNETVSKYHAEIEAESPNKTVFIRDMNSSNRTRINKSKLRPNSSYQIRNGDELIFGNVIARFKLYQQIDDSIVSCTPQVNRKLPAIIPGTPDSSMNTSSASENDISLIPGTQTDNIDSNFRQPTGVGPSKIVEQRSPRVLAFTLNDLPSPTPDDKNRQENIWDYETQKFVITGTKVDHDDTNNIYTAVTQKPCIVSLVDLDNGVHEMATQKPFDLETDKLENLTTQQSDDKNPELVKVPSNETINELETQQFKVQYSNVGKRKSLDISIHSAETQKIVPDISGNESIVDLETQQYRTQKNVCDKSESTSIEDLETQAVGVQKSNIPIKNLESQQIDFIKLNTTKNSLHDISMHSALTQKILEEQKIIAKSNSYDVSIYSAPTQRDNNVFKTSNTESLENVETQQFIINTVNSLIPDEKSNTSIYEAKTQECKCSESNKLSIDNLGTQEYIKEIQNEIIDESTESLHLVDETPNMISSLSITIQSTKSKSDSEDTLSQSVSCTDSKRVEKSFHTSSVEKSKQENQTQFEIVSHSSVVKYKLNTMCNRDDALPPTENIEEAESALVKVDNEDMFSQNLIQDCPFAFLPEDSTINENQSSIAVNIHDNSEFKKCRMSTSNIINNSTRIDNQNSKNANIKATNIIAESDSETDEEGIFNNYSSIEKKTNQSEAKCNSDSRKDNVHEDEDSETDEEGVFSNHLSNKCENNIKKGGKIDVANTETDSETDEEGIFSDRMTKKDENNSLSKKRGNDDSDEDIFDNISANGDKSGIEEVVISPSMNNCSMKKSPITDLQDIIFDTNYEEKESSIQKPQVFNNSRSSEDTKMKTLEIDSSTQENNTHRLNDTDTFLATTQVMSIKNDSTEIIAQNINNVDLAPTKKLSDTQLCTESEFSIDTQLAPTQIVDDTQFRTKSQCTSSVGLRHELGPTEVDAIDRRSSMCRNSSTECSVYENESVTESINGSKQKESVNQSKRQLEELEIACNKKLKSADETQNLKLAINTNAKESIDEIFGGSENKSAGARPLALHLQNILESSHNDEDSLITNLNEQRSSPTLGSKLASETRNCQKAVLLSRSNSLRSATANNLNDTIERNLNDIFDDSVNSMDTYEPEEIMTQQLKNILQSQDDHETECNGSMTSMRAIQSPILCKTYEKKKNQLNLSVKLNSLFSSKEEERQEEPELLCAQSSLKSAVSEEIDDYFDDSKRRKKCNVIDCQSEVEPTNIESIGDNEREIVYKRGTIGFSSTLQAVSTKEPVELFELKNRSYTSDSQSEGDESFSILSHKKRFSLSLPKHIDLNSSLPTLNDQEVRKKMYVKSSIAGVKVTGNKQHSSSSVHREKKLFARGDRSLTSDQSKAEQNERDEELQSISLVDKKVCTSKLYHKVTVKLNKLSPLTIAKLTSRSPRNESVLDPDSDNSDDSEFLKSMPPIKVAGTVDCPPTNSQLAAFSDIDDDNENGLKVPSPVDIVIPTKWSLYREKRYDLVYKMNAAKPPKKILMNNEDENCASSPSHKKVKTNTLSVEDVLAEIDANQSTGRRRIIHTPKKCRIETRSVKCSDVNVTESTRHMNRTLLSSVRIHDEIPKDNDSDSESNIIPKFTPLERFKLNITFEDDSDSDTEFEQMRQNCERTLARSSTYAHRVQSLRSAQTPMAKSSKEKVSPVLTRRRRPSALKNYSSLNVKHNGNDRQAEKSTKSKTVDESAFVFQEADDNSSGTAGSTKTTQPRTLSLTTIRTKRSVTTDVDDVQLRPVKRSKTTTMDDRRRSRLQQLSVLISPLSNEPLAQCNFDRLNVPDANQSYNFKQPDPINVADLREKSKSISQIPKTLDGIVIAYNANNRTDSNDLSAIGNSLVDDMQNEKSTLSTNKKSTKHGAFNVSGMNSSKENLILDVQVSPCTFVAPNTRLKSNATATNSSAMNNSDKKKISKNAVDSDDRRKKNDAQATRQRKHLPVKESILTNEAISIIQDSDAEVSDESRFFKVQPKSRLVKAVKLPDFEKTNDLNVVGAECQNQKDKNAKQTISGKLHKYNINIRANQNIKGQQTQSVEHSDSEQTDRPIDVASKGNNNIRTERGRKVKDSNTNDQNKIIKEAESEKSDANISKRTRSKRMKQNAEIKIDANAKESDENNTEEAQDSNSKVSTVENETIRCRPVRQTRKKKGFMNASTVDGRSSAESQDTETENTETDTSEVRAGKSQNRTLRRRKPSLNNSEDSQNTESNFTEDNNFEKPVHRPKRARVAKATKNNTKKNTSVLQKRTPSPEVPSTPSRSTPARNRRTMSMSPMKGASYKVLFTGERSELHRKIVAKLGGSEVEDPEKCSILVTDKVRRTYKFLCCLARGIPIVSVDWINDSGKARHFQKWENYILRDPTAEAKFKFKLKESLEKAANRRLLEGYHVLITPQIVQPPVTELKGMVVSSGGKPLIKPPTRWLDNTFIITKEEDLLNAKKIVAKAPKSITIHSTEFILTGILRQELSLKEFKLTF